MKTGSVGPAKSLRIIGDDLARFWSYIDTRGPDECWPWTGASTSGYGYFWAQGKLWRATNYLLEVVSQVKLLPGQEACHRCDNPPCMNLAHIFAGTRGENVRDMDAKGRRINAGAKFTPEFVRSVRAVHAERGGSIRALARSLNMNYVTLYDIILRKTWKDI